MSRRPPPARRIRRRRQKCRGGRRRRRRRPPRPILDALEARRGRRAHDCVDDASARSPPSCWLVGAAPTFFGSRRKCSPSRATRPSARTARGCSAGSGGAAPTRTRAATSLSHGLGYLAAASNLATAAQIEVLDPRQLGAITLVTLYAAVVSIGGAVATLALSRLWAPRPPLLVLMSAAPLVRAVRRARPRDRGAVPYVSRASAPSSPAASAAGLNRGLFASWTTSTKALFKNQAPSYQRRPEAVAPADNSTPPTEHAQRRAERLGANNYDRRRRDATIFRSFARRRASICSSITWPTWRKKCVANPCLSVNCALETTPRSPYRGRRGQRRRVAAVEEARVVIPARWRKPTRAVVPRRRRFGVPRARSWPSRRCPAECATIESSAGPSSCRRAAGRAAGSPWCVHDSDAASRSAPRPCRRRCRIPRVAKTTAARCRNRQEDLVEGRRRPPRSRTAAFDGDARTGGDFSKAAAAGARSPRELRAAPSVWAATLGITLHVRDQYGETFAAVLSSTSAATIHDYERSRAESVAAAPLATRAEPRRSPS